MTKEQLIQIAKVGFPERVKQFIDFNNCEIHSHGDVYRLYNIDTHFVFLMPKESHLAIHHVGDFVQITCGNTAFNHYAAIKEMERLGLVLQSEIKELKKQLQKEKIINLSYLEQLNKH